MREGKMVSLEEELSDPGLNWKQIPWMDRNVMLSLTAVIAACLLLRPSGTVLAHRFMLTGHVGNQSSMIRLVTAAVGGG